MKLTPKIVYFRALKELRERALRPEHKRLTGIGTEDDYDVIGTHTSFFLKPGGRYGYLRVYWVLEDRVEYSLIINAPQILRDFPETTGRWMRNGMAVYREWKKNEQNLADPSESAPEAGSGTENSPAPTMNDPQTDAPSDAQ